MCKNNYDLKVEVNVRFGDVNKNVEFGLSNTHSLKPLRCEENIHAKGKIMEEKKVSLEQAANYLIQLFYKTGKKYSCTRTKIGKLLSIVAFTYAREGYKLFNESVCKYEDCGTTINELKTFLERDIYRGERYENSVELVDMSSLIECDFEINEAGYGDISALSQEVKNRIWIVFSNFGAYTPKQLGEELCDLISCDGVIKDNEEIDLEKIKELKADNFQALRVNAISNFAVIDFLFSNY